MFRNTEHYTGVGNIMAEFCPECVSKILGEKYRKHRYILSEELYICEECGKLKRVVIVSRKAYYYNKFRFILLPIMILCFIVISPFVLIFRLIANRIKK